MRIVVRLIFGTVTGLLFLVSQVGAGNAQQSPYQSTVGLKPSSGPAGSSFTISWNFSPCKGPISFTWEGTALTSAGAPSGQVGATVPGNATPGSHTVTGTCTNARTGQPLTGNATFRVTGTVTTAPPTTTKVPPATKPTVPVTTPTRPGTTTTPVTTTTPPTTTPPSTTDTPPPPTDVPSPSSTPRGADDLILDRPSVHPGDPLSATGKGCVPGERVTLTSDGERVGGAYADGTGAFTAAIEFTRIEAGRHTVVADCGVRLTGAVDQVVTSSSGGHGGTLVVLVFFVLAGITVIRFP
ncbi:hypothetical protein SAMN04489729_0125 [Amycolatopsis lurida]|nr:hypothetical protein SAMN04489729_0125 [Amycolatopsis lurida]